MPEHEEKEHEKIVKSTAVNDDSAKGSLEEMPFVMARSHMPTWPHGSRDRTLPSSIKLRFLSFALLVIVSLSAGFGGGYLATRDNSKTTIQKQQVVLKSQGDLISSIANTVSPSVVSVDVTSQSQTSNNPFFGFDGSGGGGTQESAGTGIIIDKSGLIITNRHVVPAGSTKVSVTLSDGTTFDNVQVIGRTSQSDPLDIAFLKITDTKGKQLTAAQLGDSSQMKIGDSVIAIGNALGQFQNTVTSGIISGHGRSVTAGDSSGSSSSTESLQNLFQTDAAINEGNSGGPLVNLNGQVIGINTAIAGDAQNIGFAIPINDVKGVISNVLTKGKLERPYLGVVYIPVTADVAKTYNLGVQQGAYIPTSSSAGRDVIIAGSPAAKAGLKEGDIITKVDDQAIDASHSLTSLLGQHSVGDKVTLSVYRDSKTITIDVTLDAAPESN